MNDINAAKRLKESAYARAEGEKILKVKRYASLCDVLQLNDDNISGAKMFVYVIIVKIIIIHINMHYSHHHGIILITIIII